MDFHVSVTLKAISRFVFGSRYNLVYDKGWFMARVD